MSSRITPLLVIVAVVGILAGARALLRPLAPIGAPDAFAAAATSPDFGAAPLLDSLAPQLVARDPFRLTRRPAAVAYDPLRLAEQQAPPAPRPALVLVGLVTGMDPTAVIQGLPGVDGPRVLRVGDQVAGIKVRKIVRDAVWVVGMDSTWVLTIKGVR